MRHLAIVVILALTFGCRESAPVETTTQAPDDQGGEELGRSVAASRDYREVVPDPVVSGSHPLALAAMEEGALNLTEGETAGSPPATMKTTNGNLLNFNSKTGKYDNGQGWAWDPAKKTWDDGKGTVFNYTKNSSGTWQGQSYVANGLEGKFTFDPAAKEPSYQFFQPAKNFVDPSIQGIDRIKPDQFVRLDHWLPTNAKTVTAGTYGQNGAFVPVAGGNWTGDPGQFLNFQKQSYNTYNQTNYQYGFQNTNGQQFATWMTALFSGAIQ